MGPELIQPQTEPPHSYKRFKGRILFKTATVKGADYDTFKPLNHLWACDKTRIYCHSSPLRGADRETFAVLNALYAKDKNFAYYLSGKIPDANPATFGALDPGWHLNTWNMVSCQGYAADDEKVFHHVLTIGKPRLIKAADVLTFRVLNYGFALDANNVYHEGDRLPDATPATFRLLGHNYATDGERVYYLNRVVPGADATTFSVGADQFHAADKNRRYEWENVIST